MTRQPHACTARLSEQFWITAGRDRSRLTIALHGEFDLAVRQQFLTAATAQLAAHPAAVILDLGGLTFMGAAGINALIEVRDAARRCSASFAMKNLPAEAHRVLAICELGDDLEPARRRTGPRAGSRC